MGLSVSPQPVRILLSIGQIAEPHEKSRCSRQGQRERCRMSLAFRVLYRLLQTLPRLRGIALEPPISREPDTHKDMVIQTEINLARPPRPRPVPE